MGNPVGIPKVQEGTGRREIDIPAVNVRLEDGKNVETAIEELENDIAEAAKIQAVRYRRIDTQTAYNIDASIAPDDAHDEYISVELSVDWVSTDDLTTLRLGT
jgi:hypothetical protein